MEATTVALTKMFSPAVKVPVSRVKTTCVAVTAITLPVAADVWPVMVLPTATEPTKVHIKIV
jgi:hypothetical protein